MPNPVLSPCLPAGLGVLTLGGWRALGQLRRGDEFPSAQGVRRLMSLVPGRAARALRLPPAALGNRGALVLDDRAEVLIDSDAAEATLGAALVLMPLFAAQGWRGLCPMPRGYAGFCPVLDRPGLIQAGPGLMIALPGGEAQPWAPDAAGPGFARLSPVAARDLVLQLMAEDLGQGLRARRLLRRA